MQINETPETARSNEMIECVRACLRERERRGGQAATIRQVDGAERVAELIRGQHGARIGRGVYGLVEFGACFVSWRRYAHAPRPAFLQRPTGPLVVGWQGPFACSH